MSWPHAARISLPRLLRTDTIRPAIGEDLREGIDAIVRRAIERDAGGGIERQQVHLGFDTGEHLDEPARILG